VSERLNRLRGEAVQLGALGLRDVTCTHQPGEDDITPVRPDSAGQGGSRPRQGKVHDQRRQASLAKSEQEGGGGGPHERGPGAQARAPGDSAGGVPGARRGQGQCCDEQDMDRQVTADAQHRGDRQGQGQHGQEGTEGAGIAVASLVPGAPGSVPQLPPAGVQGG